MSNEGVHQSPTSLVGADRGLAVFIMLAASRAASAGSVACGGSKGAGGCWGVSRERARAVAGRKDMRGEVDLRHWCEMTR